MKICLNRFIYAGVMPHTGVKEMMKQIRIIGVMDGRKNTVLEQISRVYGSGGVCPTISTMTGGNRQPKVVKRHHTNANKRHET